VVGVGVDLVDTQRFARVLARTPRLVDRVFTAREVGLSGGERPRASSLAARWAAKEAVAKVLVDNRGLEWHDCELVTGPLGEPWIEVRGTVAEAAAGRGIDSWLVSLSHDGHMAIAFVVALAGGAATGTRAAP
jgi:holo-[acyl-carrier protein] synthase